MNVQDRRKWQDHLGSVVGIWIALSPLAFRFVRDTRAVDNAIAAGVALTLVSSGALRLPIRVEKLVVVVLGLWLLAAPQALGFGGRFEEAYSTMVAGVAVVAIAAASLLSYGKAGAALLEDIDT